MFLFGLRSCAVCFSLSGNKYHNGSCQQQEYARINGRKPRVANQLEDAELA